ncbi:MAG: Flp pilus assembly protein CpaB [Syntrophobacteraceae bacterium]|nr:Flp pilus assembly protein CpaB [Syntrophobacteraceae bacterium]
MGKIRALLPFTMAVIVAFAAATMIYKWSKQKGPAPVVSKTVQHTGVVLANSDLAWGTKITRQMLKSSPIAQADTPEGAFANPEKLAGRVLITAVKKNEPIIESMLAPQDVTTGGVSAIVSEGMRAIAVAGDKVIGLAGLIQPGSHVDILVTLQDPQNEKLHYTKTVLEDIEVLATGSVLKSQGGGEKPAPVDVFTVEVSPLQGEELALAATQGRLHFALRNVLDKSTVLTMGATVADLLDSCRPKLEKVTEPAAGMAPPKTMETPARTFKMEVINGTKVDHVQF